MVNISSSRLAILFSLLAITLATLILLLNLSISLPNDSTSPSSWSSSYPVPWNQPVDVYDASMMHLGARSSWEAHHEGLFHKASLTFILRQKRDLEVLVVKRDTLDLIMPDKFDACWIHPKIGESYTESAQRCAASLLSHNQFTLRKVTQPHLVVVRDAKDQIDDRNMVVTYLAITEDTGRNESEWMAIEKVESLVHENLVAKWFHEEWAVVNKEIKKHFNHGLRK